MVTSFEELLHRGEFELKIRKRDSYLLSVSKKISYYNRIYRKEFSQNIYFCENSTQVIIAALKHSPLKLGQTEKQESLVLVTVFTRHFGNKIKKKNLFNIDPVYVYYRSKFKCQKGFGETKTLITLPVQKYLRVFSTYLAVEDIWEKKLYVIYVSLGCLLRDLCVGRFILWMYLGNKSA